MLCPLMIKRAVDSFTVHAGEPLAAVVGAATHFVLLYGLCDVAKNVAKELQAPLFTPVSQVRGRGVREEGRGKGALGGAAGGLCRGAMAAEHQQRLASSELHAVPLPLPLPSCSCPRRTRRGA